MASSSSSEVIGIVGSGLIGRSWAMLFVGAGYTVRLYDVNPDQLTAAVANIAVQLTSLSEQKLLRSKLDIKEQLSLLSTTTSLSDLVNGAIYIQECVWENVDLKKQIFKQLDEVVKPGQIMASSVSTIMPSAFTSDLKHKEYCIVAHPVNPPFYLPLVELVPNPWTKPEVMLKTEEIMKKIGQEPVKLKREVPGFALNRMQYALLAEAWRLVQDDVVDCDGIDKIFTAGLGRRYAVVGPMEATHLNAAGERDYCAKYYPAFANVMKTFGPTPAWEGELLDKVASELEQKVPLDQLAERSLWRDSRLAALAKLKMELDG